MDKLKNLEEVLKPDVRSTMFGIFYDVNGKPREKRIEDHYAIVSNILLHDSVPEEIQQHFETTKNLLLYSWFVYRFIPVAEFHAASTLEYALKIKTDGKVRGLYRLIDHAISKGWVKNEGFKAWDERERLHDEERRFREELANLIEAEVVFHEEPYDYVEKLKETLPDLRNAYAHGSNMLYPGGYGKLEVCAEFINQLFEIK